MNWQNFKQGIDIVVKFTYVFSDVTLNKLKLAEKKLTGLCIDLGIRDDNYYVGTGMGGNNLQLLTITGLNLKLTKDKGTISFAHGELIFSLKWFINSNMKMIRQELNKIWLDVSEQNKLLFLPLRMMLDHPTGLVSTFDTYQAQFPTIVLALKQGFSPALKLSLHEELIMASVLCAKLAQEVDAKNLSNTASVGVLLLNLSEFAQSVSIRKYITIERLMKHSFDEMPIWKDIINRIVKMAFSNE